jgi:formylglycine-generating enzyme required for sulfatase activity
VLDPIAWYCDNSGEQYHRVAEKQPNAWGLYDMLGNLREWTDNVYTGLWLAYNEGVEGPLVDPMGAALAQDPRRSLMGETFHSLGCQVRAANHFGPPASLRGPKYGLRPARTLPTAPLPGG